MFVLSMHKSYNFINPAEHIVSKYWIYTSVYLLKNIDSEKYQNENNF